MSVSRRRRAADAAGRDARLLGRHAHGKDRRLALLHRLGQLHIAEGVVERGLADGRVRAALEVALGLRNVCARPRWRGSHSASAELTLIHASDTCLTSVVVKASTGSRWVEASTGTQTAAAPP